MNRRIVPFSLVIAGSLLAYACSSSDSSAPPETSDEAGSSSGTSGTSSGSSGMSSGDDILSLGTIYGDINVSGTVSGRIGAKLGVVGNVIWFVLAGWWLALGHIVTAILLAVTIVGIPFAWAHLKLAGIALWPIGKVIVPA